MMRNVTLRLLVLGLAPALLGGCASDNTYNPALVGTVPAGTPDFAIAANPGSRTVAPGEAAQYTVTLTALNGFAGAVSLSVSGLPADSTATFTPAAGTPTGEGATSTLRVQTTAAPAGDLAAASRGRQGGRATPTGSSTLTIRGTAGSLVRETTVALVVAAPGTPDFIVAATPATRTVTAGQATTYTVTLTAVNQFTNLVNLSLTGLPANATTTLTPAAITPTAGGITSALRVQTAANTPAGTSTLTIRGTSGSTVRQASVTLVVNAAATFSLTATPASRTVAPGETAAYTITATAVNGFSTPVALSVSGLPADTTATFTPPSVTPTAQGAQSTLQVQTSATVAEDAARARGSRQHGRATPAGTSTLTIRGTAGTLVRQTTVTLVVSGGGPVAGLNAPNGLAFSPDGQTLYVSNQGGLGVGGAGFVMQLRVGANGSLTQLTPPTLPSGSASTAIVAAPGEPFVYVTSFLDTRIFQFGASANGTLSALSPASVSAGGRFGAGESPNDIAITPAGTFVYTANGDNSVSQLRVNADNTLTLITQDRLTGPTHANGITVHPNGQFVYAVGSQAAAGEAILAYRIGTDGRLTEIGRAGTGSLIRVRVDRSGQFLYATETPISTATGGAVHQFRINTNGTLTALSPATVATPNAWGLAQHPTLPVLYVTNGGNTFAGTQTVSQFRINANGTLAPLSPATPLPPSRRAKT